MAGRVLPRALRAPAYQLLPSGPFLSVPPPAGTKDGANIEIAREIGRGNMFLFGALASADVVGKEGSPEERRAHADFTTDDAVPDLRMKQKMNKGGPPAEAPWASYEPSLQVVLKSLQDGAWRRRGVAGAGCPPWRREGERARSRRPIEVARAHLRL